MRTAYHEQLDALTNRLAEMCGVSRVLVKDESRRGGVGSFKVLGGALVFAAGALIGSG